MVEYRQYLRSHQWRVLWRSEEGANPNPNPNPTPNPNPNPNPSPNQAEVEGESNDGFLSVIVNRCLKKK